MFLAVTALAATALDLGARQPPPVPEASSPPPATVDEFRAQAAKILEETRVPGAGIALVRSNGVEWAGGVGFADRDQRVPVTADTHFRAGSISKTFVAMALVQLYEDDKLEIDRPVKELAPLLQIDNPWEASDPVTVRQLLQHTAGFDDMHFNEMYNLADPPDMPLVDVLRLNPASRRVRWRPGTRMSYSNPGYAVAAYVLEQVTGEPYENVIQARIFNPIDMRSSSFVLTDADHALLAKGYSGPTGPPVPYSQIYLRPSGNLHTSAADLGRFVQLLLNWGETTDNLVVDPEYLSNMERPQTTLAARAGLLYGYGTGIASQSLAGYPVLGHGGGIDGFSSMYGYSAARDAGYVVLLNGTYSPEAMRRLTTLALRYLKKDVDPPAKPEATPASGVLAALEGYYHAEGSRNQILAGIEWLTAGHSVSAVGNTLQLSPVFGPTQTLVPVSDSLFRLPDAVTPSRVFTNGDDGRMTLIGDGFYAPRVARWRVEAVRATIFFSLVAIATVPLMLLVWLLRVKHARPRRFWPLKLVLLALPLSLLALASLMLWAPAREWGVQNLWTRLTFAGSVAFPVLAVTALVMTLDAWHRGAGRWLRAYALVVAIGALLVSTFLVSAGLIGFRPWAY
jgi:CubicO group peptidase (beta-lactamase class C family)/type IV secretory pathway VirB2 component (pilin)